MDSVERLAELMVMYKAKCIELANENEELKKQIAEATNSDSKAGSGSSK